MGSPRPNTHSMLHVTIVFPMTPSGIEVSKPNVKDALLDTIVVENGSSQGLYDAIKSTLTKEDVSMSNILGFTSDDCSTLMGNMSGFQKLLRNNIPTVFTIGCVYHSFALCSSHAVKVLPSYLRSFLKDLTSSFSQSSKCQNDFNMIQSIVSTKENKIPKLLQTGWLLRENVINAIIEQWDALVLYFQSEAKVEKVDRAKRIYETMINKWTKHMLLFLHYILKKVNALYVEFQSEHVRLHLLYTLVSSEYESILSCFIKEDVLAVSKLSDIDLNNTANHKDMSDIYLGGHAIKYLEQNPIVGDSAKFKIDCKSFLRFPLDEAGVFALLEILDPKVARGLTNSSHSIILLTSNFPAIAPKNMLDEWRLFLQYKDIPVSSKSIPEFWYSIHNLKDGLDHSKFERLSQFMTNVTVLPHSLVCVKCIFSQINCIKTKCTNRLKAKMITDRLLAKQAITRKGASHISWELNAKLIKDVVDESCHRRLNFKKEGVNEDDVDMYKIDN
uniref:HAT C-terminal dimerisation domain-containing protein n=1 Tax=Octopus bimaculoides TaxID=37653 RepID=A0A0L8FTZ4_OCTBM